MSYKDKPQIKLYKYENSAFVLQAIIDDYQEVSFEHNIYEAGTFTITINYNIPNALLFQRGLFCQFGNNPYDFGEIYSIQDAIGQDGKGSQIRTITGRDARYILKRRVIKNMNSNGLWAMTDKGEIVLRNLIKDQCGIGAEAKRQLPIANTIPASADAKGKVYSVSENFTNLYEVCKTIATQSEIGWRMAFDGSSLSLEVFEGADLSQTVRFDTNFESLANGEFSDSSDSYSNAIYIGGKGQNDDRDIYEGEDGTPQGLDRFESWDNQSSLTVESEYEAEALSMLTQYGQTLTMNGNGLAKCPYVFREQYDIGDTVTVAFSGKSAKAQILSITEHWTWGAYDISFAFGKPQNNLSDQLQLMLRKIQEASNKTNSTDSVRWYTIPTDTAMPKADVTYSHIGFVGTVGTNATFTLYLDNQKTGAKTYHVYFKQLGGTGKLTLTTGKAGATNLVMNVGTYVAIIYVDENGNVTTQGATPTTTISSGNTQPAESGAVYEAIENAKPVVDTAMSDTSTNAVQNKVIKGYVDKRVPKRTNGYLYNPAVGTYWGSSGGKYFRIKIPKGSATWCMAHLEVSLRTYTPNTSGKILIHANWSSANEWNEFKYSVYGDLKLSNVKVYGSDKQYIYIYTNTTYTTCSLDRALFGDNITSQDISAIEIDSVSSLPATYQTAILRGSIGNAYCATEGSVQAKVASIEEYTLANGNTFPITFANSNSYNGAITLNVNETGAKPIYIKGSASSSDNKTLPAGTYLCYYNGTNYYIDTVYAVANTRSASSANVSSNTYALDYAVTCSTAAGTATKTVSLGSFNLIKGARIIVNLQNANTIAQQLYLNVNSTGAKPIIWNGTLTDSSHYAMPAGYYNCYYDGTSWYMDNESESYKSRFANRSYKSNARRTFTCSIGASTVAKTVTVEGYTLSTRDEVLIYFSNTNTASNPTLNVSLTGAKPIKIFGLSPNNTNGLLKAGVYYCQYDGTNWDLYPYGVTNEVASGNMQAVSSNAVANVTKVWTDISSQVTLTITENNASVTISNKKVYMCGALLKFDIFCDCYANISEGEDLCKIQVTSSLFTLPYSLSRWYNPSYYGDGITTAGMNVYEGDNGVITVRMTKRNLNYPIGDFSFCATIPCQLS